MASEEEVLRYKMDIGDAERKSQRLQQLLEEIKAKRGRGEDVSKLEAEFHKEADGLGRMAGAQKKAAGETEDLVRQKEKLANVVTLVGGRFGGLVANLGNVTELLMSAGPLAATAAAAMVGFVGVVQTFQELDAAIARATERLKEFEKARSLVIEQQAAPAEQIQRSLLQFGALEAGAPEKVWKYALELQALGLPRELAMGIAPQAHVAGVEPRVAAMLALGAEAGGRIPGTPAEIEAAAARMRAGAAKQALAQQLAALKAAPLGKKTAAFAAMELELFEEDPARLSAIFEPSRDDLIWQFGREHGFIPEKAGPEAVQKWRERLAGLQQRRAALQAEAARGWAGAKGGRPGEGPRDTYILRKQIEAVELQIEELSRLPRAEQAVEAALGGGDGQAAPAPVYDQRTIYNVGTMYNAPDKRKPTNPMTRMGVSKQDHRKPP